MEVDDDDAPLGDREAAMAPLTGGGASLREDRRIDATALLAPTTATADPAAGGASDGRTQNVT